MLVLAGARRPRGRWGWLLRQSRRGVVAPAPIGGLGSSSSSSLSCFPSRSPSRSPSFSLSLSSSRFTSPSAHAACPSSPPFCCSFRSSPPGSPSPLSKSSLNLPSNPPSGRSKFTGFRYQSPFRSHPVLCRYNNRLQHDHRTVHTLAHTSHRGGLLRPSMPLYSLSNAAAASAAATAAFITAAAARMSVSNTGSLGFAPRSGGDAKRAFSSPARRSLDPATRARIDAALVAVPDDMTRLDPNTLSNYDRFRTTRVIADLEIDFEKKILHGSVTLKLRELAPAGKASTRAEAEKLTGPKSFVVDEDRGGYFDQADEKIVVLDSSFVDVKNVTVDGHEVEWSVDERTEPFGSAVRVRLPENVQGLDADLWEGEIRMDVATTDKCTALQWLTPEQTSNGKFPYMFSQCQAIHARSIFPCQDTPDVKAPVEFNIRSPLPVLASGLPTGSSDYVPPKAESKVSSEDIASRGTLLYRFKQEVPIPIYLFALASGDVASASIGPRSCVCTGPEELLDCKWELEKDMERFMQAAERLVFPYDWTTYNVLVLPSSFPYGGMENPVMTFATPTIISGDRQNIDVVAHELAHSWSGNLVSNRSWQHFWLNEGWTVYLERRILGAVHGGNEHRDFSALIGWKALSEAISQYGPDHEFTKLVIDLKHTDPDDAFSSIPYEKGFNFLYYLEKLVGQDKWDRFVPHYFGMYRFKSLDSFEFQRTVLEFFADDEDALEKLLTVDWKKWYFSPGFPVVTPEFDDTLARPCYQLADRWRSRSDPSSSFEPAESDIAAWTANQSVVFLEALQTTFAESPVSAEDVDLMGRVYPSFREGKNVEVLFRYFTLGLKAGAEAVYGPTAELLGKVGRMKFVRPLYRDLAKRDEGLAKRTFEQNKGFYHPICRAMVEKDLFG